MVPYQNDAHNQQPQKKQQSQGEGKHGIMEKLTLKTPSDVLSFIGHTLGFWPQESLVCITMNDNSIGATLRIDLPNQPGQELSYAQTVAHYLTSDATATSILFAVYTSETSQPGQARPQAGTIAALTGVLAEQGITIRDGLFVGDETFSPNDDMVTHRMGTTTPPARLQPHQPRTRSTGPHGHRLHQLVGRQRKQSTPIPPTRPRPRPRLPARPPQ
jgi:hypothetical protein